MDALQIYSTLSVVYENCYFGSYEELNVILDNAQFPCAIVVPVSRTVQKITDRYKIIDTVVVASLEKLEYDIETKEVYAELKMMEKNMLKALFPISDKIANYQVLSELTKFDANVIFAAFSIDITNNTICFE